MHTRIVHLVSDATVDAMSRLAWQLEEQETQEYKRKVDEILARAARRQEAYRRSIEPCKYCGGDPRYRCRRCGTGLGLSWRPGLR